MSAIVYLVFAVAPIVCEGLVLDPCFVLQYFVSFLVLQSSRWGGGETELLYFCCVLTVMLLLSLFDSSSWCHGLVCDCGIY